MNRALLLVLSVWFLVPFDAEARTRRNSVSGKVQDLVEEALVQPPRDKEVCFSPDSRCDLKLVKFIESARKSIDVAVFDINLDSLVHQLLVKSKTIRVRVLADRRQSKGPHSLVSTLVKGGVEVRIGRQRGVMHHKFTVIDGTRLETGSFNYTNHASRANQENQLYLDDPGIVARYQARFEESWSKAKPYE